MMMSQETREQRRTILKSSIEQFLDHLEDDFDNDSSWGNDAQLGSIVICAELSVTRIGTDDSTSIPTYWSSNENPIWQRGFFEILCDYKTININSDEE